MTENEKEKKRFRQTKAWKEFRERKRKQTKKDFVTGKSLTGKWELHHLDLNPSNYTNLEVEDNFIPLNSRTHTLIHFLYIYYRKDRKVLDRVKEVLDRMIELNS